MELLLFNENHQISYFGECTILANEINGRLDVTPTEEDFKVCPYVFKQDVIKQKNVLFIFASGLYQYDFVLILPRVESCNKVFEAIQKAKDLDESQTTNDIDINSAEFQQRFFEPILIGCQTNEIHSNRLKEFICNLLKSLEKEEREKYLVLIKENSEELFSKILVKVGWEEVRRDHSLSESMENNLNEQSSLEMVETRLRKRRRNEVNVKIENDELPSSDEDYQIQMDESDMSYSEGENFDEEMEEESEDIEQSPKPKRSKPVDLNALFLTIQEFISFLDHPNITIQRGAFVMIGQSVNETDSLKFENIDQFINQVAKKFVNFVNHDDINVRKYALLSLLNIGKSNYSIHVSTVFESGIMEYVNDFLQDDEDPKIIYLVLNLLMQFSIKSQKEQISNEIIKNVVNLFKHKIPEIYGNALIVASNLATGTHEQKQTLIDSGALKNYNKFIHDSNEEINAVAVLFLGNILTDSDFVQRIFDEGFIPQIIGWLQNEKPKIQKGAISGISHVIVKGTFEHFNSMLEMGMLSPFCKCFQNGDIHLVLYSFYELLKNLDYENQRKVCMKLEEKKCILKIREIYEAPKNEEIQNLALTILSMCEVPGIPSVCQKVCVKTEL